MISERKMSVWNIQTRKKVTNEWKENGKILEHPANGNITVGSMRMVPTPQKKGALTQVSYLM